MASITTSAAFTTDDDLVKFFGESVIRKLTAVNYDSWKIKMETILIRERLWPIVYQQKVRPLRLAIDEETILSNMPVSVSLSAAVVAYRGIAGFRPVAQVDIFGLSSLDILLT